MTKHTLLLMSFWGSVAAGTAVASVYIFYTLLSIELRYTEIIAALVLPLITAPTIVYYTVKKQNKIHELEKDVEIKNASLQSYKNAVSASNHINNNLMNTFSLVMMKLQRKDEIGDELLKELEKHISESSDSMKVLNSIEYPHDIEQYRSIYPNQE